MHRHGMRDWILLCAVIGSAWVKWCVGLGSYSGQYTPPMFGDYEAQRHWMEITVHLPIRQWYTYDLQYWGLDYPPVTAYVSWICGFIGSLINPTWFVLDKSRGIESEGSKVFMRATVLMLDHIVYVPALWMFTRVWHAGRSRRTQNLAFLTLLLQPALLLVDFGHFQYNSVMLGFTLLAVNFFIAGQDLLGAFFFVLSLCFKQMALYYAPAVGSYLIGKCLYLGPKDGLQLFIRLAIVTSISFLILFLPFLPPFAPISTILDPITRIFPFDRGIFEDKVANFWCASNVVIKWKFWASRNTLVRISTLLTAVGFVPAAVAPVRAWLRLRGEEPAEGEAKGNKTVPAPQVIHPVLLHALLSSAMSFFLFSFQVHEKTILLPLMPLSLLLSGAAQGSTAFKMGALVNNVAVFSMWPLLSRDGQAVQYIALLLLWNRFIGHNPFRIRKAELLDLFTLGVYAACFALHILEFVFLPPARYPDLFPVLNVLISTPIFVLTWLWSMKSLIEARWTVGGLGLGTRSRRPSMSDKGHSDVQTPATEDGIAPMISRGIGREFGLRAQSLGYRSGKRRAPVSRAASVGFAD
ncbi:glycosyltransferase family 57 protein [Heterobasidion irregulare TC 32-1]|uniref:Alpha-1,3-glucosyltransferase n=1 Tax=Heterobasidion irregulare (strain TC 32-1) TaxID=747525 RepID=W4K9F3_HETIT|nr:glycosyltransferase family 57 protein [Heterobasidion irregulare TC 32-1]ETW81711.1 glycosyltransferase family 57 protein [Heterobasidion irregulare TC 32-1]